MQAHHAPVYCPLSPQPRQIRPTPPVFPLSMSRRPLSPQLRQIRPTTPVFPLSMSPPVYHRPPPPSPLIAPLHYTVLQYPPQELQHRQSAPHVPVFSASRWISPTGSYDPPPSSQPSSQMMQEPSSHTLSAVPAIPSSKGKRPAQEDSGSGITKKVCFFFFCLFWSLIC